jgi:hypothetical protein
MAVTRENIGLALALEVALAFTASNFSVASLVAAWAYYGGLVLIAITREKKRPPLPPRSWREASFEKG